MTNLGPRQERQAMLMAQSAGLHLYAVENYLTCVDPLRHVTDDQEAIERLDVAIKTAESVKNMLIKANESVTKS